MLKSEVLYSFYLDYNGRKQLLHFIPLLVFYRRGIDCIFSNKLHCIKISLKLNIRMILTLLQPAFILIHNIILFKSNLCLEWNNIQSISFRDIVRREFLFAGISNSFRKKKRLLFYFI